MSIGTITLDLPSQELYDTDFTGVECSGHICLKTLAQLLSRPLYGVMVTGEEEIVHVDENQKILGGIVQLKPHHSGFRRWFESQRCQCPH